MDNRNCGILRILTLAAMAFCLLGSSIAFAGTGPSWWYNPSLTTSGTAAVGQTGTNDYAAVNQGQVKNLAVTAVNELDNDLAQFGGSGLQGLALILTATSAQTNNYAALNLGQLKTLIQPFYDRLLAVGYNLGPLTTGSYPWLSSTTPPNDYAIANIGQVKYLFDFDLTTDANGNGIPDWWEHTFYPGTTVDPNGYDSGDGSDQHRKLSEMRFNPKVQLQVEVMVK